MGLILSIVTIQKWTNLRYKWPMRSLSLWENCHIAWQFNLTQFTHRLKIHSAMMAHCALLQHLHCAEYDLCDARTDGLPASCFFFYVRFQHTLSEVESVILPFGWGCSWKYCSKKTMKGLLEQTYPVMFLEPPLAFVPLQRIFRCKKQNQIADHARWSEWDGKHTQEPCHRKDDRGRMRHPSRCQPNLRPTG